MGEGGRLVTWLPKQHGIEEGNTSCWNGCEDEERVTLWKRQMQVLIRRWKGGWGWELQKWKNRRIGVKWLPLEVWEARRGMLPLVRMQRSGDGGFQGHVWDSMLGHC